MIQVKTFELSEKGSDAANEFIKGKRLIENGVQIRDNAIIVLFDNSEEFDEKSKEVALIMQLSKAEANLMGSEIQEEYYTLAEAGGKMTEEMLVQRGQNRGQVDGLKAQVYILKKRLNREVGEPSIFGKKQYKDKKK